MSFQLRGLWLVCVDQHDESSGVYPAGNLIELATFQHRTAQAALRRLGAIIGCQRSNGNKAYRPLCAKGKRFYAVAPDGERLAWSELRNRIDLVTMEV